MVENLECTKYMQLALYYAYYLAFKLMTTKFSGVLAASLHWQLPISFTASQGRHLKLLIVDYYSVCSRSVLRPKLTDVLTYSDKIATSWKQLVQPKYLACDACQTSGSKSTWSRTQGSLLMNSYDMVPAS